MDRKKITAWVTKYALTTGIERVEGEADDDYLGYDRHRSAVGNDWHRTEEAAIKRAKEMRLKKIASSKKQLEKLEKMRFESNGEFPVMVRTFYPAIKKDRQTGSRLACAAIYDGNKYGYLVPAELNDNEMVVLAADLLCATAEEAKTVADEINLNGEFDEEKANNRIAARRAGCDAAKG